MQKTLDTRSWEALETSLARSFIDGVTWPVGRGELAALIDLGMSESLIATYFAVEPSAVRAFRERYRI